MAEAVTRPGEPPLIAGDKTLAQVTADICAPLERRASGCCGGWRSCRPSAFLLLGVAAVSYQIATGIGTWGLNRTRRLGLRHHQLRLLDRHRPCRHADLRDPVSVSAAAGGPRSTARPRR